MQVYQKLASLVGASIRNLESNNKVWYAKNLDEVLRIVKEDLPHGSGIDNGVKIDLEACDHTKLVFTFGFHHMDDNGFYDLWTEHKLTVRPGWQGPDIKISGRDHRAIKEYLYELFNHALTREIESL